MSSQKRILLLVLLSVFPKLMFAQSHNSTSMTMREYREDTVFWEELTIENYYDDKLVYKYKRNGVGREDSDFEMTTNFYDHYGNLVKTVLIEEDQYDCPPKYVPESYLNTITIPNPETVLYRPYDSTASPVKSHIIPDSIPTIVKFCGRHYTKTTRYFPYLEVSNVTSYYDEKDTVYVVDSLFTDRYGDETRQVTYAGEKLILEYRYNYIRDIEGRIIEKVWENLTPKAEFKQILKYVYHDDRQFQVYGSTQFFKEDSKKGSSKIYYDEDFEVIKSESFKDDSLTDTHYYTRSKNYYKTITINTLGDTVSWSEFVTKRSKNHSETWGGQSWGSPEYQYGVVDTIRKKDGYRVKIFNYRITKQQFDARDNSMKKRNLLNFSYIKDFDKSDRLICTEEYNRSPETTREYRYEYKELN